MNINILTFIKIFYERNDTRGSLIPSLFSKHLWFLLNNFSYLYDYQFFKFMLKISLSDTMNCVALYFTKVTLSSTTVNVRSTRFEITD